MAKVQTVDVEVWVMVDEQGQYVAHCDADKLVEVWESDVGEFAAVEGCRRVKLTVKVPLPEVIELSGAVELTEEPGELKVA